uniref:Uncharacterized protein n=1 Tax=Lotharella globosa TaxID=91324 RepID=A0A7S4DNL6_9EUKA|mmetsp:Transcript_7827/g.15272  ORF Transcript_7827/g.15272 Transcript_7827/m.15272 type:complete len:344 (+) Transcript_7827:57-1088(+)|eukprot:CAMPEP_0167791234 /NCGR_PEP_ID=MMETSP0111_2-20121227/11811_1 /TAXON_ID=91324 /ORGANISM="Lotharella globosa, Strain CCCM811" /LENGTH=343 /DNA_ID=CAMNT_0007683857 /DNA_START=42 /DNA_END=1073 /DNA_ORIENTATION=+
MRALRLLAFLPALSGGTPIYGRHHYTVGTNGTSCASYSQLQGVAYLDLLHPEECVQAVESLQQGDVYLGEVVSDTLPPYCSKVNTASLQGVVYTYPNLESYSVHPSIAEPICLSPGALTIPSLPTDDTLVDQFSAHVDIEAGFNLTLASNKPDFLKSFRSATAAAAGVDTNRVYILDVHVNADLVTVVTKVSFVEDSVTTDYDALAKVFGERVIDLGPDIYTNATGFDTTLYGEPLFVELTAQNYGINFSSEDTPSTSSSYGLSDTELIVAIVVPIVVALCACFGCYLCWLRSKADKEFRKGSTPRKEDTAPRKAEMELGEREIGEQETEDRREETKQQPSHI